MPAIAPALPARRGERLFVDLATAELEVREAQSLRFRVFGEELGARLQGGDRGLDVDAFDGVCQHLLVREVQTGRLVGCTRLLTDVKARELGGFYSQSEFDLGPLVGLPGSLLEIGRTCIDPEYRQGAAIAVLWSGLAAFMQLHRCDYLFGCASIPLGADDIQAAAIMNRVRRQGLTGPELRVSPRVPLRSAQVPGDVLDAPLPPLLKAYLRLGARACGEPCRDPDFGVADVLILLRVADLNPVYARHFIERLGGA
ncbi:GNAT family N-acetyltransferase [Candidatus Thiodictyon syntrophicum]|jgi:putative hemolysin|uniref:L-ornithine N(alpha)-acyltransferase n=1 Tax=Candidatus Thiodictyon syntrophicum TaxID=1166950 RepID=A0A2K8U7U4_9GAMM|nr:GNAT family N-acyltransferase [Candidatus Thiodictyon syntrophicum]AUB81666.1 hemolysin [Candidatus Thiodictyon syntrophicum]